MTKIRTSFQFFLISMLILGLSACGFHLRGENVLPPALHTLYLQADDPYGAFTVQVISLLRDSNVILLEDPQQAAIRLYISKPEQSISGSTVGNSSEARVYTVIYRVRFSLLSAQGKTLLKPQTLTANATLTLNANQLIESNNQLEQMVRELQRNIINQLFNRLVSQQVFKAVALTPERSS